MTNYAIFGATSAIAEHTCRALVSPGARFLLVARDREKLEKIAGDLRIRGTSEVLTRVYDFSNLEELPRLVNNAIAMLGPIDQTLIAFGVLTKQAEAEKTPTAANGDFALNFAAPAILSQLLANHMFTRSKGLLAVVTSVSGDRGRGSNYFYGAAKGGLGLFLQGLRHSLAASGIEVLDIRPGFVDTPMTQAYPKGPLWAKPAPVGAAIARAMRAGSGGRFYVPHFWAFIMFIIRSLPVSVFHKTKL